MLLGYHVSTSGGLHKAFQEAEALECTAIQIFVGSPQMWNTPTISEKVAEQFKQAWKKSKVKKVLVHAAYLPNPSSPRETLRRVSLKKMKEEIRIAYAIGADGYNFHPGSNANGTAEGIKLVTQTLNRLAELSDEKYPIPLIIESDAGSGNKIGDSIEELGAIWKGLKNKSRFGFTLDTCHMFVSGIDVRTKKNVDEVLGKFDKLIGLKHLHFIHLNDALFDLGSKRDRHANIGEGFIGLNAFKHWVTSPKLKHVAFILETPRSGNLKQDLQDILRLKRLVKAK
jgi:deoxyribonuclease-4